MITMEMIGKIRRLYVRDKLSLHEIAKRTGLSRNTIRKWVRPPETVVPICRRMQVSHLKLCASRAFWLVAYPSQGREMHL